MTTLNQETEMRLAIPVSLEDHLFVENVCTNGGYTFKTFFSHCLNLYRKSLNEPLSCPTDSMEQSKEPAAPKKNSTKKR